MQNSILSPSTPLQIHFGPFSPELKALHFGGLSLNNGELIFSHPLRLQVVVVQDAGLRLVSP